MLSWRVEFRQILEVLELCFHFLFIRNFEVASKCILIASILKIHINLRFTENGD